MALEGADTDHLRALATAMASHADDLQAIRNQVGARLAATPWRGLDARAAISMWEASHGPALDAAVTALRQAQLRLTAERAQQVGASSVTGGTALRAAPGRAAVGAVGAILAGAVPVAKGVWGLYQRAEQLGTVEGVVDIVIGRGRKGALTLDEIVAGKITSVLDHAEASVGPDSKIGSAVGKVESATSGAGKYLKVGGSILGGAAAVAEGVGLAASWKQDTPLARSEGVANVAGDAATAVPVGPVATAGFGLKAVAAGVTTAANWSRDDGWQRANGVATVGFDTSMAVFSANPVDPVAVVAVGVTGAAWGVTEVGEHWKSISPVISEGWNMDMGAARATTEYLGSCL